MKSNVIMFYAPEPATGGATASPAVPAAEVTSPKLVEIRTAMDAIFDKQATFTKETPRADKVAANVELFKLGNDEKAEIANIKKAENDAKIAEARNARVKMLDDLLAAYSANQAGIGNTKLKLEDKNALNDTYHKLRENVVNELLAKYAKSTPATATATGDKHATGTKGSTSATIREAFIANRAAGMTDTDNVKAIIASGQSRGTTGAVVLAYQREIGEKA